MDNALGRKLTEAYSDKKIIIAAVIIRFCIVLFFEFAILGDVKSRIGFEEFFDTQAMIRIVFINVIMIGFCLFPLRHIKDYMIFYEKAICYKGKIYMLDSLLPVSWSYSIIPIPLFWYQNEMITKQKVFNIAYMKDVDKQFNRAYLNII